MSIHEIIEIGSSDGSRFFAVQEKHVENVINEFSQTIVDGARNGNSLTPDGENVLRDSARYFVEEKAHIPGYASREEALQAVEQQG